MHLVVRQAPSPMKPERVICYLILLLVGVTSASALTQTQSGRVFRVVSGDRLVLIDSGNAVYAVRLAGIKAPAPDQPFGADARTHLQTLLLGRFVSVHYENRVGNQPILGKITFGGADMNLRQIQAGLARFRPDHGLSDSQQRQYAQAERQARAAGQGMWGARFRARRRSSRADYPKLAH